MAEFDVVGIGNPLIDVTLKVTDEELAKLGFEKGSMNLIDEKRSGEILGMFKEEHIAYGCSAANTLVTLAGLGVKTAYIGKVGSDEYGKRYEKNLKDAGVQPFLAKDKKYPTGTVLALITPDAERTMAVSLGASLHLSEKDIDEKVISKSSIVHTTGYDLEDEGLRNACIKAFEIAKKEGKQISVDLADGNLVTRAKEHLKKIIADYATIVFANETESLAYTGLGEEEALNEIGNDVDTVCVKIGAKGSLITFEGMIYCINGLEVDAIDATGAGDSYAAGILFGIIKGMNMEKAGELASTLGAEVVKKHGPRLDPEFKTIPIVKELLEKYGPHAK